MGVGVSRIFLIYKTFNLFLVFIFNSALDLDTAVKLQYDGNITIVLQVILVKIKNHMSIPQHLPSQINQDRSVCHCFFEINFQIPSSGIKSSTQINYNYL